MKPWPWLGDEAATPRHRGDLWRLLGPRPVLAEAPSDVLLKTETTANARVETWLLTLNSEEPVPAILMRPLHRLGPPPRSLVLYCHAHGNRFERGKDELLIGRPAIHNPPYGETLPN